MSPPTRGEWIEIAFTAALKSLSNVSPHTGEWIEIFQGLLLPELTSVSPHTGGVD